MTTFSTHRTVIVGDVHGMFDELVALLDKVELTKEDHLVLIGDLLDKGPDSAAVVRHLRELRDDGYNLTLVLGNHEAKHELFRAAHARGRGQGMKDYAELAAITDALSPEDVAFLESGVLFLQLPQHNAIVVHAGIPDTITELPETAEGLTQKTTGRLSQLLRTRFVRAETRSTVTVEFDGLNFDPGLGDGQILAIADIVPLLQASIKHLRSHIRPRGGFLKLGANRPEDPFWADVYGVWEDKPRFGHVYFGHNPFIGDALPRRFQHATGLDLGCVFGGQLAAVVLTDDVKRSVTISARKRNDWDFATPLDDDE